MSDQRKTPAVVAELGRPETAAETAERRAKNSTLHRERQTATNLIYALIATVALVLVIVMIVPRATPNVAKPIDYGAVAAQGAGSEPDPLVDPRLPKGFYSNSAQLEQDTSSGVDAWYIGLITPSKQYLGLVQGFDANPSWVAEELKNVRSTGTRTIAGVPWTVYDPRKSGNGNGNVQYALAASSGASTYLLYGTASDTEFTTVARALSSEILKNGAPK